MTDSYRFSATLNRPQGSQIFKGTANGCRGFSDALFVIRELLKENDAFQPEVTSIKIALSPLSRKSKSPTP